MRILILAIFALLAAPALAQDWGHYDNGRFGYSIEIPPDYLGLGESDNGDGQEFQRRNGAQRLRVWGGLLGVTSENFEAEVTAQMAFAADGGWNQTYQAVTPEWASFSAIKGKRILYQRVILLCDRQSYAAFSSEYSVRNSGDMDPVIEQLAASLRSASC